MDKQVDAKKQLWYQKNNDEVLVGFTPEFIETVQECWHVIPTAKKFKEKDPFISVETNDELISICSPFSGTLANFNSVAQDFPDQITSDTVIATIAMPNPKKRATKKKATEATFTVSEDPVPLPPLPAFAHASWLENTPPPRALDRRGEIETLRDMAERWRDLGERGLGIDATPIFMPPIPPRRTAMDPDVSF